MVEYLDSSIANDGFSVNNWVPGAWTNQPDYSAEDWQPDVDPPRINDYAAFKKHKHYGRYFRPYRRVAFPAFVYHPSLGEKLVQSKEEVLKLGPDWTPFIPIWHHATLGQKTIRSEAERDELGIGWAPAMFDTNEHKWRKRIDMTGKSLPVKSETQRLAEVVAQALAAKETGSGGIDPTTIAGIVAAVMAATQAQKPVAAAEPEAPQGELLEAGSSESVERAALLELAETKNVKVDKRWSNDHLKKELGL